MTKIHSNSLSYFRLSLLSFIQEGHPEKVFDTELIDARADLAATTYAQVIKDGYTHFQAEELANEVLYQGLHFSKHDTLVSLIWNEFAEEIPQDEAKAFAIRILSECESIFAKYPLSDDFAYCEAFDILYTELTGTILIWLENHEL